MKCPKCGGELEEGILTPQMEGPFVSLLWVTNIKLAGLTAGNRVETKTFKCKSCGYLESYAK